MLVSEKIFFLPSLTTLKSTFPVWNLTFATFASEMVPRALTVLESPMALIRMIFAESVPETINRALTVLMFPLEPLKLMNAVSAEEIMPAGIATVFHLEPASTTSVANAVEMKDAATVSEPPTVTPPTISATCVTEMVLLALIALALPLAVPDTMNAESVEVMDQHALRCTALILLLPKPPLFPRR